MLITAVASFAGAAIFHVLRIPAGALLGAMVGAAALNLLKGAVTAPPVLEFASLAVIGWTIGAGVTSQSLSLLQKNAIYILVPALLLLVFGAGLAWFLAYVGALDPMTAYLSTAPGSIAQMAAMGATINARTEIIVAMHTVRIVSIILIAPVVATMLKR